jgi:hypothetical protein
LPRSAVVANLRRQPLLGSPTQITTEQQKGYDHGDAPICLDGTRVVFQERGEVATNLQIFAGDRLIVGRNEIVKKTVEIDRLNAPIQAITGTMLQEAFMLRALQLVSVDHRDELLKEYIDFWAKELFRSTGEKFDEQTLRDAFIRKMKLTPAPVSTNPAGR